jgi:two-component system sensor histidine kinase/response regulator
MEGRLSYCDYADSFPAQVITVIETTATSVFDYSGAMERMGHDQQLFQDMVAYLNHDGPRWLDELKAAAEAGDLPRVQHRAHSLKGLISNFGAARAWQAAASLEDLARAKREEGVPAAIVTLSNSLTELIDALGHYRSHGEGTLPQRA